MWGLTGGHWSCAPWRVAYGLRAALLLPSALLAHCWRRGLWARSLPSPESVGFALFVYVAALISLEYCTAINTTCGRQLQVT